MNLFSENRDLFRGSDSQFDLRMGAFEYFHFDSVADHEDFPGPAADYQHKVP